MGPEMSLSEFLKAPLISAQTDLFSWEPAQRPASPGTQKNRAASLRWQRGESMGSAFEDTKRNISKRCSTTSNKMNSSTHMNILYVFILCAVAKDFNTL